MTAKDEALKLALEALENSKVMIAMTQEMGIHFGVSAQKLKLGEVLIQDRAITAIKQALATPVQEPVEMEAVYETIIHWDEGGGKRSRRELARRIVDLYTTPPAAQPAVPEGMKLVRMQPHELAEKLYWEHPTYRGTKPLQWRDAPNEVRREWLDKAKAMLAAAPEKGGAA
jgi:hypothetical protein